MAFMTVRLVAVLSVLTICGASAASVLALGPLDVASQSVSPGACEFQTAPGATPAFCDDLSGGTSPGGRAGDLDDAKWSVGRFVGEFGPSDLMPYPQAPATPCKANVTAVNS